MKKHQHTHHCLASLCFSLLFCLGNYVQAHAMRGISSLPPVVNHQPNVLYEEIDRTPEAKNVLDHYHERIRLKNIYQQTNTLALVLFSELVLQKGDPYTALSSYVQLFRDTKNPQIAEQAMNLAMALRLYPLAQSVYEDWQKVEPIPSVEQRRLGWELDILLNKSNLALKQFPQVLQQTKSDKERGVLFLFISQLVINNITSADQGFAIVRQEALKYPELPQAIIANAVYSAFSNHQDLAVKALQKLAYMKKPFPQDILLSTLSWINQYHPAVLDQFFDETNTTDLSDTWKALHVAVLIRNKQAPEAYQMILNSIKEQPTAERYIQAGYLSIVLNLSSSISQDYFEKAYAIGNEMERSRAALFAALDSMNHYRASKEILNWVNRIKSPNYSFDKYIILATIAQRDDDWDKVGHYLDILQRQSHLGVLFSTLDQDRLEINYMSHTQEPKTVLRNFDGLIKKAENQKKPNPAYLGMLYNMRAMYYADRLHENAKAESDLKKYLALNPNNPQALNTLGYNILELPGRTNEGVELIEKAYERDPNNPAILDSLGWGYLLQGKNQEALALLQQAYANFPEPVIGAHLGAGLWVNGRQDEAMKVWRESWNKDHEDYTLLHILQKYGVHFDSPKIKK